jgi:hypothetical protein
MFGSIHLVCVKVGAVHESGLRAVSASLPRTLTSGLKSRTPRPISCPGTVLTTTYVSTTLFTAAQLVWPRATRRFLDASSVVQNQGSAHASWSGVGVALCLETNLANGQPPSGAGHSLCPVAWKGAAGLSRGSWPQLSDTSSLRADRLVAASAANQASWPQRRQPLPSRELESEQRPADDGIRTTAFPESDRAGRSAGATPLPLMGVIRQPDQIESPAPPVGVPAARRSRSSGARRREAKGIVRIVDGDESLRDDASEPTADVLDHMEVVVRRDW